MKKTLSQSILVIAASLMLTSLPAYASVKDDIYPEPSWVNSEYYETDSYAKERKVDYITELKWYGEINEAAFEKKLISAEYYYKFKEELKKSISKQKGSYSSDILLSSLKLSCYEIFDDHMLLIENLDSEITVYEGIKMMVELFHDQEIALTMKYKHPYKDIPEEFSPYVGYADKMGWLESFDGNGKNSFSYELYLAIMEKELNYSFEEEGKYDTSDFTLGALASEIENALDNMDLNNITNFRRNQINRNKLHIETADFIDTQNYYLNFREYASDVTALMSYYSLKYPEVSFSGKNPEILYTPVNNFIQNEYKKCSISFLSEESMEESISLALDFLKDFGMPEDDARELLYENIRYTRYNLDIDSLYEEDSNTLSLYFYYDYKKHMPIKNQ